MEPLVSVIIPSYGGGEFINRTVDSVLAQTYQNIEIIVVDDNGLETEKQLRTAAYMSLYKDNPKVRYICHDVNKNGSAARNTGVENSTGKYIGLLDDDDVYYPNKIATQVKALDSLGDEYALTYCSLDIYRGDKKVGERIATESGSLLYEVLMHDVTIGSSSMLVRRSVWEALNGFDESFRRHQDWEFTARIAANYKVYAINEIGFRRYLEFRNSPKTPEKAVEYRKHYLEKMQPYISTLTEEQQKDVIISNRMAAAVQYLKTKQILEFMREYHDIKPGIRGIMYMIKTVKHQIMK